MGLPALIPVVAKLGTGAAAKGAGAAAAAKGAGAAAGGGAASMSGATNALTAMKGAGSSKAATGVVKQGFAEKGMNYAKNLQGKHFKTAHDFLNQRAGLGDKDAKNTVFSENREEHEDAVKSSGEFLKDLIGKVLKVFGAPLLWAMKASPMLGAVSKLKSKISDQLRAGSFNPPPPGQQAEAGKSRTRG